MKPFVYYLFVLLSIVSCNRPKTENQAQRWSEDRANLWYQQQGWRVGCNFIPSTAINQLEMWQAETFDTSTIDRELGYAENIGFNTVRVYLHHLAWQIDHEGFKKRVDKYLAIADKHGIKTIFVIFDDCWNPKYKKGKQPEPKTGIHNSGWIRDPGDLLFLKPEIIDTLELYVKDILKTFKNDSRVLLWDLYNEPGNSGYGNASMPLLRKVFDWAREVNPSQPISSGVWNYNLKDLNDFQVNNSDIITYHNYENDSLHKKALDTLKLYKRPIICTEYMARTRGSLFSNILPLLKKENVGAINWGLVSGKTNTIYAWDTPIPDGSEPAVWFHDIFRPDGSPYKAEEVELIKSLSRP
ncbi:MAG: cellulase family glycosylhydrolase [Bacteroidales bacterium]|nr:cellulase family glycosylhydrolase [Bacteroidales bacterium]